MNTWRVRRARYCYHFWAFSEIYAKLMVIFCEAIGRKIICHFLCYIPTVCPPPITTTTSQRFKFNCHQHVSMYGSWLSSWHTPRPSSEYAILSYHTYSSKFHVDSVPIVDISNFSVQRYPCKLRLREWLAGLILDYEMYSVWSAKPTFVRRGTIGPLWDLRANTFARRILLGNAGKGLCVRKKALCDYIFYVK